MVFIVTLNVPEERVLGLDHTHYLFETFGAAETFLAEMREERNAHGTIETVILDEYHCSRCRVWATGPPTRRWRYPFSD
jgi:hypothetical protein